ncbi:hypothetical protein D3C80_1354350 [compost metagenome]
MKVRFENPKRLQNQKIHNIHFEQITGRMQRQMYRNRGNQPMGIPHIPKPRLN